MLSLSQIESDLITALKAKNELAVGVLRALKTRIQNEQIAKQKELSEVELFALTQSEIKRRKEAAESFTHGNRPELATKELQEAEILGTYLPLQATEEEIVQFVDTVIAEHGLQVNDFGKAMGLLKEKFGSTAEGATLAKILKEKLK